jgi:hypothetical protein
VTSDRKEPPWCSDPAHVELFYKELRDHLKHEDNLCNNRMTWLITLQAFLFTAYGFSLSAEAVLGSNSDSSTLLPLIKDARTSFALVGAASALIILAALCAAMLSISKLVSKWYEAPIAVRRQFPQIIGNSSKTRPNGTYLGQTPLYLIPLLSIVMWARISYNPEIQWIIPAALLGVFVLGVSIYTGVMIERRNTESKEREEEEERREIANNINQ